MSAGGQTALPGFGERLPDGLVHDPRFLSPVDHDALLGELAALPYGEFRMRGVAARRRVVHFGWGYDPDRRHLQGEGEMPPIPEFLLPLRDRCAALARTAPRDFEEALATWYPPGASIGWHRDAPQFGTVVGVSFGSPCRLRFRRDAAGGAERAALVLAPGSAYVLAGSARWAWEHHIPPVKADRWSVTFRTVRQPSPSR